ncbi:MAG TPA: hypothetical protein VF589_07490 [Allosphingosinicella sp.]|jgi:predicted flap endonuclease-1-like 5' DNA nuclease
MTTVFENNLVPIIVALLIGLLIGWWMFRSVRRGRPGDRPGRDTIEATPPAMRAPAPPVRPYVDGRRQDGPEGNNIADHGAAAAADVAGQVLGVSAHSQLPGASGPPDNLQMLKGVGPKLAEKLNDNGIIRFEQLARLSTNEVDMLESRLGPFKGRLARDRVVEQASYLARDDRDGFEARFGKLGGP